MCENLLLLRVVEGLLGSDDDAKVGVVLDEAFHEHAGGEIGFGCGFCNVEGREATPEIKWVGQSLKPDFFGKKNLRRERGVAAKPGVTPADELVIFNNVMHLRGIDHDDAGKM